MTENQYLRSLNADLIGALRRVVAALNAPKTAAEQEAYLEAQAGLWLAQAEAAGIGEK